jgi:hypothetical protein
MFNPELVERYDSGKSVKSSDYDTLLQRYREALDCILGMVSSNADAMTALRKAGLVEGDKVVSIRA